MRMSRLLSGLLFLSILFALSGCKKNLDLDGKPAPAGTLVLEFAKPVKYSMEISVDGENLPIRYSGKNRVLRVENLKPGSHTYNIHSVSYVFGPEFSNFTIHPDRGAYFFIQSRKYRGGLPQRRSDISIRAYRKQLKKDGINLKKPEPGRIHAAFSAK